MLFCQDARGKSERKIWLEGISINYLYSTLNFRNSGYEKYRRK